MPITEKQIERRKSYLGSSDMAAICGLSPWDTAKDIWIKKVFPLTPGKGTEATERGIYLESGLLDFASQKTGYRITRNQFRAKGIFGANIDGLARLNGGFLGIGFEAKTTNLSAEWGEEGTDQVPDYVALQCHHQMYCADLERVFIPVLTTYFGRLDMRLYKIERDDKLIAKLVDIGSEWWEHYVVPKTPPPQDTPARIELLKRIEREPEKVIALADELVSTWDAAQKARLEAEKMEKQALATLLEALGDAEAGMLSNWSMFTYLEQKGADRIDRKLLQSKYPEIYAEIASPTTHRTPRIKKAKEAKK